MGYHGRSGLDFGRVISSSSVCSLFVVAELRCLEFQLENRGISPRCYLLLSGVTPLSGVLHQLGGGVMLPNWCNAP